MLRDYEMKSSCHMIEEGLCFLYPLHLVTCKSVLFFVTFYATKVTGGILTFGKSRLQKSLSFNKYSR